MLIRVNSKLYSISSFLSHLITFPDKKKIDNIYFEADDFLLINIPDEKKKEIMALE